MKKSDLKSGMIVELGNGKRFLILKDIYHNNYPLNFIGISIKDDTTWLNFDNYYDETMMRKSLLKLESDLDIARVYVSPAMKLIWEREDKSLELKEFENKLNELADDFKKLANRW